MNGAGNTDNDVNEPTASDGPHQGEATTNHELRSERSGRGDGRTYTIHWQASFNGTPCESSTNGADVDPDEYPFHIEVPHDMRCGADWKGGNRGNGGNGQCAQG